jgi:hypothetical protein
MAMPDPQAKAKDATRCQLCPSKARKSIAETVCNTCNVNLCKDCVGHHMTSKPTIRHDVVTFELMELEIILPQCKLHKEHKCDIHCKQCDTAICQKCLASGSHENHDALYFPKILSSKKQLIEKDTQQLEGNFAPECASILSEIDNMLSNVLQNHRERQQAISDFGKRCHTLVDVVIDRYLIDSKENAKQDRDSIQTLKSEFEKLQTSIQSTINDNRSILASNDLSKFTSYVSKNEEFRSDPSRFQIRVPPLDFREPTEKELFQFIGVLPSSVKIDIAKVGFVRHPASFLCQ